MIVPVEVLARARSLPEAQLPAYLYDLAALRTHVRRIREVVPDAVELFYAVKANPEPPIVEALASCVDGYDVSSGGELRHVRRHADPQARIAFSGPGKTAGELALALRLRVERVHVESERELHLLNRLAPDLTPDRPVPVLLRVNLSPAEVSLAASALRMGGQPSPFGFDPAAAESIVARLASGSFPNLDLRGIHTHLASGLDADDLLASARSTLAWTGELATRHRVRMTEVNLGGGMAVDYRHPDVRFDWTRYGAGLARLTADHPGLTIRIEPGRALTAYCGWYLTEVLDIRHSYGEDFAIVRGGTHHLRTPVTKGHDQPHVVVPVDSWPYPWPRPATRGQRVSYTGQLCTPKDVLARRVPTTEARAGDRVLFAMAGAYAWHISHHDFLMHPHPSVHYLRSATGASSSSAAGSDSYEPARDTATAAAACARSTATS